MLLIRWSFLWCVCAFVLQVTATHQKLERQVEDARRAAQEEREQADRWGGRCNGQEGIRSRDAGRADRSGVQGWRADPVFLLMPGEAGRLW